MAGQGIDEEEERAEKSVEKSEIFPSIFPLKPFNFTSLSPLSQAERSEIFLQRGKVVVTLVSRKSVEEVFVSHQRESRDKTSLWRRG